MEEQELTNKEKQVIRDVNIALFGFFKEKQEVKSVYSEAEIKRQNKILTELYLRGLHNAEYRIVNNLKLELKIHKNTDNEEVYKFLLGFLHRLKAVVSTEVA